MKNKKVTHEELVACWNRDNTIKEAKHYLTIKNIKHSKEELVTFFRTSAREYGYSIPIPVLRKKRIKSEQEIIEEFGAVVQEGGFTYADWCGTSIKRELRLAGYSE